MPAILFSSFCSAGDFFLLLLLDKTNILPQYLALPYFMCIDSYLEARTLHCLFFGKTLLTVADDRNQTKLFVLPLHLI